MQQGLQTSQRADAGRDNLASFHRDFPAKKKGDTKTQKSADFWIIQSKNRHFLVSRPILNPNISVCPLGTEVASSMMERKLHAIVRVLLPEIQAFLESGEGQREFAEWKARREKDKTKIKKE